MCYLGDVVVRPGEEAEPAVVEPPARHPLLGAVVALVTIVVLVWRAELHPVMTFHRVPRTPLVIVDVQPEVVPLTVDVKCLIECVNFVTTKIPEIKSNLILFLISY